MDPTSSPAVRATTADETDQAVAVIVLAFSADPVARWSFPDPAGYLTHFPAVARALGGDAFAHGTGHHSAGFTGAALWLPPGVAPDEEALGAAVTASMSPERQPEVFGLFEQMASYHPAATHWYLPLIGVDPQYQGKGHGSALLRHALTQCDRDHAPAYLESTNPANIPLYQRHGFRDPRHDSGRFVPADRPDAPGGAMIMRTRDARGCQRRSACGRRGHPPERG